MLRFVAFSFHVEKHIFNIKKVRFLIKKRTFYKFL